MSVLRVAIPLGLLLGGAGYFIMIQGKPSSKPPVVAVLDSGIVLGSEFSDDERERLLIAKGWDFVDDRSLRDEDPSGHGTAVTLEVLRSCKACQVIPVRISDSGSGTSPQMILRAIRHSHEQGARFVVIPMAVKSELSDPDANEQFLRNKREAELLIQNHQLRVFVSLGVGVQNPYRPEYVDSLFPQSVGSVELVEVVYPNGERDPHSNRAGSRSVTTVRLKEEDSRSAAYGSSLGAARAAALEAQSFISDL